MNFENFTDDELKHFQVEIQQTLSNRKSQRILEKMEDVRKALAALYEVDPYCCFADTGGEEIPLASLTKLYDLALDVRVYLKLLD